MALRISQQHLSVLQPLCLALWLPSWEDCYWNILVSFPKSLAISPLLSSFLKISVQAIWLPSVELVPRLKCVPITNSVMILTDILVLVNIYKTSEIYISYYFSCSLTETLWLWKLTGIFLKSHSASLLSTFTSHILKTKIPSTQSNLPINLNVGRHHRSISTILSIFFHLKVRNSSPAFDCGGSSQKQESSRVVL